MIVISTVIFLFKSISDHKLYYAIQQGTSKFTMNAIMNIKLTSLLSSDVENNHPPSNFYQLFNGNFFIYSISFLMENLTRD